MPHPLCYTNRMKMKNTNNQKNITFTMSNGLQVHILETSVFRAHLKVLKLNNWLNWNLEVIDIKV